MPEFFLPGDGAFLVNRHRLALGTKQNGCANRSYPAEVDLLVC